jgi:V/A-type H+-transporting ATPase subunit F
MKMFVISDNIDTYTGLKLAGINGVVLHEKEEIEKELKKIIKDKEVGIVIVTEKIVNKAKETVQDIRLKNTIPLIVEIPDRHLTYKSAEDIDQYISKSIGI